MSPQVLPQGTFMPLDTVSAKITLTWRRKDEFTLASLDVKDSHSGRQLMLSVSPVADWTEPTELATVMSSLMAEVVQAVFKAYVQPEPF